MSLSPFDSFQSRFVTYLLNFPRICGFSVWNLLFVTNLASRLFGVTPRFLCRFVHPWIQQLIFDRAMCTGASCAYLTTIRCNSKSNSRGISIDILSVIRFFTTKTSSRFTAEVSCLLFQVLTENLDLQDWSVT